ncbi:MAG: transketolase, partial [Planctomycetales bacterium]|nr:transketolase [Planctomycetales bacterium]
MSTATSSIERLAVDTIRTLSMDGVQQANSGHPGTPMALAPVAYALWNNQLNYDPAHPHWPARDRFILSCGHASMLLYSVLHLAGVKKADGSAEPSITLNDLKNFRQLHSPCAGHPEFGDAAGIEMTTGPLGQGVATSVGMAAAAKWLAARYDRPGHELFGFNVYALCSDGDIMEGIGAEAASLGGHLKLSNLCWIYDDNRITIEGHTDLAFTENVAQRFAALGWNTVTVEDANDVAALGAAIENFKQTTDRPTLIIVKSVIGFGSPNKADSHEAHGAPLGEEEVKLTKAAYGWDPDKKFHVPGEVLEHFAAGVGQRGAAAKSDWDKRFATYEKEHAAAAQEWKQLQSGQAPAGWDADLPTFAADAKGLATRASSGQVLNAAAKRVPWLIGGSADLAPSNNTHLKGEADFEPGSYNGRNFHFGVREHAMAAAANGMALAGVRPYVGTFFIFSDYLRPSMRLSAIMRQPVLYVLTHDSIGLGEDGTTHQPVEQLAACRAIPRVIVMRPGDANEVAAAYRVALTTGDRPMALVLTRQNVPTLDREKFASAAGVAQGAYVLADAADGKPDVILIGTGSELSLAVAAYESLTAEGIKARVVSMPSWELFDDQPQAYRDSVLPP